MTDSFVAVDVETANADMASICQIGVVSFSHGEIVDSWEALVDPEDYFDEVNVSIHGIDEAAVQNAPTLPQVASHIAGSLSGRIVASHMPFDRTSIARALDRYGLEPIRCTWIDTARVTRRAWPQFASRGYGVGNWHLYSGDTDRASSIFRRILEGETWMAFGYLAAEAEMARRRN